MARKFYSIALPCVKGRADRLAGFTLIETLVAVVIVGLVVAAATSSLITNVRENRKAEVLFEAAHAAQTVIDEIRYEVVNTLPTSGTDSVRTIYAQSRRQYSVYVTYCDDSSYCTSSDVRQISLRVAFKGQTVYSTQTVFTAFGSATDDDNTTGSSSIASSSSSSAASSATSSAPTSASSRSRCRTWRC